MTIELRFVIDILKMAPNFDRIYFQTIPVNYVVVDGNFCRERKDKKEKENT